MHTWSKLEKRKRTVRLIHHKYRESLLKRWLYMSLYCCVQTVLRSLLRSDCTWDYSCVLYWQRKITKELIVHCCVLQENNGSCLSVLQMIHFRFRTVWFQFRCFFVAFLLVPIKIQRNPSKWNSSSMKIIRQNCSVVVPICPSKLFWTVVERSLYSNFLFMSDKFAGSSESP